MIARHLVIMLILALPASAQTADEERAELAKRLARIQEKLNYGQVMAQTSGQNETKTMEFATKAGDFAEALEEAESTAAWMGTTRRYKFTGMSASISWPPAIDLHFEIMPEPTAKAP